jgi:hypothetical protein
MFTPRELTRFRLIKQMAQNGQAAFVSRADKQWVLDIMARENRTVPAEAALCAMAEGYTVHNVAVETIAI